MIKQFLIEKDSWQKGLVIIRVISGVIIAKYGLEAFDPKAIEGYSMWLTDLKFPFPVFMVYLGKLAELIGGICLSLGLFTRLATIPLMITMIVITFIMGQGQILSNDEHPFLLFLLFLTFFFVGPGKWSLDHWLFKNKKLATLLLFLIPIQIFAQLPEDWIKKPQNEWPQIALVNEVWYQNGDRYVHPSFEYAATGFLIDTGEEILAATAKHVLWIAKTKGLKTVDINNDLKKWLMHPKESLKDSVIINQLINTDAEEYLQGKGSTITERDWLVFSVTYASPNIQALKIRDTPLKKGEKVYFFGCPYEQVKCNIGTGKILDNQGNKIIFSQKNDYPVGGASGAAIVDKNGYLVGILGGSSVNLKNGKPALYGTSVNYLRKVLNHEKPLNIPLITMQDALYSTIIDQGIVVGLQKFKNLQHSKDSHFIYNFSDQSLNTLALKLFHQKNYQEALQILQLSLKENPWWSQTHLMIAQTYEKINEFNHAKKSYQKVLNLSPENEEAVNGLLKLKNK